MEISRGDMKQLTLRVGDAERDACAAALIDHHLHGRLSVEELTADRERLSLRSLLATLRSCWPICRKTSSRKRGARAETYPVRRPTR